MITLLQLDYFRRLAASEHITATAKELFISQTALSSMIISLERELGVQLFDRSRRSIRLNAAGKTYLIYVNQVFAALENGLAAIKDLEENREQQFSMAVGTSLVWVPMLHAFRSRYPDTVPKQSNLSVEKLNLALQEMTVDYVIAGDDDITVSGLHSRHIKDDGVYLVVPENHPLAGRDSIFLEEIKDESFISLPVGTPWRSFCDRLLEKAGLNIHISVECDYTMRAPLIASGFGVALTSSTAKSVDLLKPNRYIRIADPYAVRNMCLFWNPARYMSKAALIFRDFCVDFYKDAEL
ncbi:MAG: LysR family transcriptional regulator [Lachnospiraceae bacterium]|nr:LysR family transcriptional regulator [Lachnospiraceae bacterium]